MQTLSHARPIPARFLHVSDELSVGIDPAFDAETEELEREFAELRLQLNEE